jgi:hypothetical protein
MLCVGNLAETKCPYRVYWRRGIDQNDLLGAKISGYLRLRERRKGKTG